MKLTIWKSEGVVVWEAAASWNDINIIIPKGNSVLVGRLPLFLRYSGFQFCKTDTH